jgi:hypothetical protein
LLSLSGGLGWGVLVGREARSQEAMEVAQIAEGLLYRAITSSEAVFDRGVRS